MYTACGRVINLYMPTPLLKIKKINMYNTRNIIFAKPFSSFHIHTFFCGVFRLGQLWVLNFISCN